MHDILAQSLTFVLRRQRRFFLCGCSIGARSLEHSDPSLTPHEEAAQSSRAATAASMARNEPAREGEHAGAIRSGLAGSRHSGACLLGALELLAPACGAWHRRPKTHSGRHRPPSLDPCDHLMLPSH